MTPVHRSAGRDDPLAGLTVFERGWLSSNNVLVHAAPGEAGAVLFDSGHLNHAPQTVALLHRALGGAPLALVLNTHLHSDHCGGNAALRQAFGAALAIAPGLADAVQAWDESALTYAATGQRMQRFAPQRVHHPGEVLVAGGREWELLAAPGHDPHSLMLLDRRAGVLLSADALWGNGFGVVFPELEGEPGFDDVGAVLDRIAGLPVKLVVPGHGAPFTDVADALGRARARLAAMRADPARHAHFAIKALTKYHLMEERRQALPALRAWAEATPLFQAAWRLYAPRGTHGPADWAVRAVQEMLQRGQLQREGDEIVDV
jgi:glyoxylase-like metal-dependent hydrolase (beta-lactamase superfamily II)